MRKLLHCIVFALSVLPVTGHGQIPNEVRKTAYQYLKQHGYIEDSVVEGAYTFYVNEVAKKKYRDSVITVYEFSGNLEHGKIILLVEYLKPKSRVCDHEVLGTENTVEAILKVYDFLQNHDFTCAERNKILSLILFDLKRSRQ